MSNMTSKSAKNKEIIQLLESMAATGKKDMLLIAEDVEVFPAAEELDLLEAPQPAKESTTAIRQITVVILRYLNLSFFLFNSVSITVPRPK